MQFRKGDRVQVIAADPENAETVGKAGVVFYEASQVDSHIYVKGIDKALTEAVRGYRSYTPDQLRHA